MKIRLMGAADLVQGWAAELEREYAMRAAFYPMRGSSNGLRAYLDLDDRQASDILKKRPVGSEVQAESKPPRLAGRGKAQLVK